MPVLRPYAAVLVVVASLAAGCGPQDVAPDPSRPTDAVAAPAAPAGTGADVDAAGDGDSGAPSPAGEFTWDFIVSTNEPFWRLTVDGDAALLEGPDTKRRLAVAVGNATPGGYEVIAADGSGGVEAHVSPGPCEDSMSGAVFRWRAELVIDEGAPVAGCARRLDDPQPRPAD